MPQFRKKPPVVEAITFDELVEYGKNNGGNVVRGMPWSFEYRGTHCTHENDDCYLVHVLGKDGYTSSYQRFERGMMLVTFEERTYPMKPDIFAATYEPV